MVLAGVSGTEHEFQVSRLSAGRDDAAAVYVLLGPELAAADPAVLHVAETTHLEDALTAHRDYPCMQSFAESVGWLAVDSSEDRAAIAADLASGLNPSCEGCWPPVSESEAPDGKPYPDRVVGGCTTERALVDVRLEQAIRGRRVIRFMHQRDHVEAEPRQYGLTSGGMPALFAYRTGHGAGRGSVEPWSTFPLAEIHALVITDRMARGARPTAPSPIEVTFAEIGRPSEHSSDIEEVVALLRSQVMEVLRMEARATRLRYRLTMSGGPRELSAALARVEADQGRVAGEVRALIPIVAGLQQAAAADPGT